MEGMKKAPEPMTSPGVEVKTNLADLFVALGPEQFIRAVTEVLEAVRAEKEARPKKRFASGFDFPEPKTVHFDVELRLQLDEEPGQGFELEQAARDYLGRLIVEHTQPGTEYKGPHGMWISAAKINYPAGTERLRKAIEKVKPGILRSLDQLMPIGELAAELLEERAAMVELQGAAIEELKGKLEARQVATEHEVAVHHEERLRRIESHLALDMYRRGR